MVQVIDGISNFVEKITGMQKSEKKLKKLAMALTRENNTHISGVIDSLRDEQPFEGAVSLLTTLYDKCDDIQVRKAIELFMNDLKDPSVRTEVIAEINKSWKSSTTSMLVSSCWQSGLDYSGYSDDFVKTFLKSDYVTAIECLTVISESAYKIGRTDKRKIISMLKDNPITVADEKSVLMPELISILEK